MSDNAMTDRPIAVPVIGALREQATGLRNRAEELRARSQDVVRDAVGPLPPMTPPPEDSKPVECVGGLLGGVKSDLEAIGVCLDLIAQELDRL